MIDLDREKMIRVLQTIKYFNLLDYAPTTFEIWRFLFGSKKENLLSIRKVLDALKENGNIFQQAGFYFLSDYNHLPSKRRRGKKVSIEKIQRMLFWSSWLRILPFVRAVFVRGALAMGIAENKSDWDILVVTAKKRIWLGRLGIIILLSLLGKRRSGRNNRGKTKDRFCLNHFLSEDGLILEKQNQFIAQEEGLSFPLWGAEVHKKFLNLNYFWLKQKRANFEIDQINSFWTGKKRVSIFGLGVEEFLEKIGWAEKANQWTKKWMIRLIKSNPKTNWPGADIRYSDQALVFIPCPWKDNLEEEVKKINFGLKKTFF